MPTERDHIFISYASQQSALCDWLARKLAAEGYAVWYDRLKLLGGENWPNDIDVAIDERTFRMLALLSHDSIVKSNPTGEWLKGRAIGEKLGIEDFVIPLNTDGLQADEIPWNLQTINYIPFSPSWAYGLAKLLGKLQAIDAPRSLPDGRRLALSSLSPSSVISNEPEDLIANCFVIEQIPKFIRTYKTTAQLTNSDCRRLRLSWARWEVSPSLFLAFHDPPASLSQEFGLQFACQTPWSDVATVEGIDTHSILVSLIKECLDRILRTTGFDYCTTKRQWYFPFRDLDQRWLSYVLPSGRKGRKLRFGIRMHGTAKKPENFRYHLSPEISILKGNHSPFVLVLKVRVYLTDSRGRPLERRKIPSRRKRLCKYWHNEDWSARMLGIAQLLAHKDMKIRSGPSGEQQLVIDGKPLTLQASQSIDDQLVKDADSSLDALRQYDGNQGREDEWDEEYNQHPK